MHCSKQPCKGCVFVVALELRNVPVAVIRLHSRGFFYEEQKSVFNRLRLSRRTSCLYRWYFKDLDCQPVAIGVVEDHVHILFRLGRTIAISDWVKEIKRVSSTFAKARIPDFFWQAGYGAFSVDRTSMDRVADYVRTQDEHHKKSSFQDELRQLMAEHGLVWDEKYIWE